MQLFLAVISLLVSDHFRPPLLKYCAFTACTPKSIYFYLFTETLYISPLESHRRRRAEEKCCPVIGMWTHYAMNNSQQSPLPAPPPGIGSPPPLPFTSARSPAVSSSSISSHHVTGLPRGISALTSPVPNTNHHQFSSSGRHSVPGGSVVVGVEHVAGALSPLCSITESNHEIVRPKPRRWVSY